MVDSIKKNGVNLLVVSLFIFSLTKLTTIFAYIPFIYGLLLTGFFISLIVPYFLMTHKKYLPFVGFLFLSILIVGINIAYHSLYNFIFLLPDTNPNYTAVLIHLILSIIPGSLFYIVYFGIKRLIMSNE